jgi:kynureninase
VLASLRIFDEIGVPTLRARSKRLTAYLEHLLDDLARTRPLRQLTPREPERRGCQLSIMVEGAGELSARMRDVHGVVADTREPNVMRLAPVPLYSTYHDCWRAADALGRLVPPAP